MGTDGSTGAPSVAANDEQQGGDVGVLEASDRGASRGVAVDDHRLERFTERGRHGNLGAGIDLDVVGEPADHAVELHRVGRFRRAVERERQRLRATATEMPPRLPPATHHPRRCTASSAARSARFDCELQAPPRPALRLPRATSRPRARPARLPRRGATPAPHPVYVGELGAHFGEVTGDRLGRRAHVVDLALRVGHLDLGRPPLSRRRRLAVGEHVGVGVAQLDGCAPRPLQPRPAA